MKDKDIIINYLGKGKNKKVSVHIKNECTIYNVEALHNSLTKIIRQHLINDVVVENVSNIDLAGLQLLISLKKELIEQNLEIIFQYNIDKNLKEIISNCGFNEIIQN